MKDDETLRNIPNDEAESERKDVAEIEAKVKANNDNEKSIRKKYDTKEYTQDNFA